MPQPGAEIIHLVRFTDMQARPPQHVIVIQARLLVFIALSPRIQYKNRITMATEIVEKSRRGFMKQELVFATHLPLMNVAVRKARPVTPLITHVKANGQIEQLALFRGLYPV